MGQLRPLVSAEKQVFRFDAILLVHARPWRRMQFRCRSIYGEMPSSRHIQAGLTGAIVTPPAASLLPSRTGSIRNKARPSPPWLDRISRTSRPSAVTRVPGMGAGPSILAGISRFLTSKRRADAIRRLRQRRSAAIY
jgi:hypothetical protein